MPFPAAPLPANVLDALRRGNTIEAIKRLRESIGLGLKEAKNALDEHPRGNVVPIVPAALVSPFAPSVIEAMRRGNKIEAIKLLREQTGLGLKEAKDAIEASQPKKSKKLETLSPGEVPKSGSVLWLLVALAVVGVAIYYFLGGPG